MELVDEISDAPVDAETDRPLARVAVSGCRAWKEGGKDAHHQQHQQGGQASAAKKPQKA